MTGDVSAAENELRALIEQRIRSKADADGNVSFEDCIGLMDELIAVVSSSSGDDVVAALRIRRARFLQTLSR